MGWRRMQDDRTLHGCAGSGDGRSSAISRRMAPDMLGDGDLGQGRMMIKQRMKKGDVAAMHTPAKRSLTRRGDWATHVNPF